MVLAARYYCCWAPAQEPRRFAVWALVLCSAELGWTTATQTLCSQEVGWTTAWWTLEVAAWASALCSPDVGWTTALVNLEVAAQVASSTLVASYTPWALAELAFLLLFHRHLLQAWEV